MTCRICEKSIKTSDPEIMYKRVCRPCLPLFKRKEPLPKNLWMGKGFLPASGGTVRKNHHYIR